MSKPELKKVICITLERFEKMHTKSFSELLENHNRSDRFSKIVASLICSEFVTILTKNLFKNEVD